MSLKDIATAACIVDGGPVVVVTAPIPSLTAKAGGQAVITDTLNVTFTGTVEGCVGGGSGSISATAIKNKVDGKFVLRKGDTGSGTLTGTDGGGNPCSKTVNLEIIDAGQIKVRAE